MQRGFVSAIAANGAMYLNAKPVQESELATKVNEFLEGRKEKIILIKADEEVQYGAVMAAMDQLRQAGLEDIALITEDGCEVLTRTPRRLFSVPLG